MASINSGRGVPEGLVTTNNGLTDDEVLEMAAASRTGEGFVELMAGDWSRYPSKSQAALNLVLSLAYRCHGDRAQVARLFGRSGLRRDTRERDYYLEGAIDVACECIECGGGYYGLGHDLAEGPNGLLARLLD